MLARHVLPLSFNRQKHHNLRYLNCGLQIRQIWIWLINIIAREGVKIRITDLDELKQRLRTEWAKLDHVVIAAAIRQWRRR